MTVVVGVDGSGRTHRLRVLAAAASGPVAWFTAPPVPQRCLVLVDDAHRLDPSALKILAAACRAGTPMVIARRPTITGPELAELDDAAAGDGVEILAPLEPDAVGVLVATVLGRPVAPEVAGAVFEASAGLPAIAVALAGVLAETSPQPAAPFPTPATLAARVQRRFAVLEAAAVTAARVLALRLHLADSVLAAACGVEVATLATILRGLRDEGLLVPGGERMVPAVAEAVLGELPAAERRRIHDAVAVAMTAGGADPVAAAGQLRAARAATPAAAAVYREAAERLRFSDPTAAIGWYEDAADAGADPSTLAAGRAESTALLGLPADVDGLAPPAPGGPDAGRLTLVAGAVAAHDGRAARAAALLLAAPSPGPALAIPFLIGTGQHGAARTAIGHRFSGDEVAGPGFGERSSGGEATVGRLPAGLARFAEGALAAGRPEVALPLFIEAAEAVERGTWTVVLPDTPHAVGAAVAVAGGDVASAEHLLERARVTGAGGPAAGERHRLLLAWARMRAGRYESALDELRRPAGELSGRDRLLRAAIAAGIARRRGDIAGLRDAWTGVEPLLARRAVDLWQLEAVEELAVAAARLRRLHRVAPVLELLAEAVAGLGRPIVWQTALDWIHLQTAVATDDATAAAEVAARLATVGPDATVGATSTGLGAGVRTGTGFGRSRAQAVAGRCWADVLAGTVQPEAVLAATEQLHAAELPWEASRLAGQAAIRTTDGNTARRLLERARELSEPEPEGPGGGGLSDREVTVARLVLAGSTHREIGAQLYISPKTVEHHVARIRAKLGANTRAELLAMLRELLEV